MNFDVDIPRLRPILTCLNVSSYETAVRLLDISLLVDLLVRALLIDWLLGEFVVGGLAIVVDLRC